MTQQVITQYSKDMHTRIVQTNTIMDLQLAKLEENSNIVTQDRDIIRALEELDINNAYSIMQSDKEMKRLLGKYFNVGEWVYAYNILSEQVKLGYGFVPHQTVFDSRVGKDIMDARGKLIWHPTFNFAEMFNVEYLEGIDTDFSSLFSVGRAFRPLDSTSQITAQEIELDDTYILLVCFRTSFFSDTYSNLSDDGSLLSIVTPDRRVLSHNNEDALSFVQDASWLPNVLNEGSGTLVVGEGSQQAIVGYDTSKVTGWTLVKGTYIKDLMAEASSELIGSIISFVIPLGLISLLLGMIASLVVTRPLRQLFRAIGRTASGDFTSSIPVQGYGELSKLITQYNYMNERIAQLIDENYEIRILEREAQIDALNAQINPHFLYNTLNLINVISIDHGIVEISKMINALSTILRYTIGHTQTFSTLREELLWLDNYIYIMSCRYEDNLSYEYYIETSILDTIVPRLFLQPFIENAFVHGFRNKQENCKLTLRGFIEGEKRCFLIIDNGCGMKEEDTMKLMDSKNNNGGIHNAYMRMTHMYDGQSRLLIHSVYGEGTVIDIEIPN